MRRFSKSANAVLALGLCLGVPVAHAEGAATIRRISLIEGSTLELEIAASGPIKPRAQIVQGPDRLVLDFPGAVPAQGLRTLKINRGDVMDARIGLFSSNPPVTRVVLDLKSPVPYQLFPSGNTVVVKFASNPSSGAVSNRTAPAPAAASPEDAPETVVSIERPRSGTIPNKPAPLAEQARVLAPAVSPVSDQQPQMEVLFQNGLLSIHSTKANLSEVLSEVHRRTGAEIAIPPGAESEQVFTNLGPGTPTEILASLLNGSHFNFIVMGSERDPGGIRRVVLTPKQGGAPEAVVYPCGSPRPAMAQSVPEPAQQPAQAFEPPMPPEQVDSGDPQDRQAPPQQPQQ
jgi:hypothetical protein